MIAETDLEHCRNAIRTGSLSFYAASRVLPARVRDPALALYAFCRLADDLVDEGSEKVGAVLSLHERLDLAYAGRPRNAPADRAFAAIVEDFEMPRALPDALLEGLAWDARGDRYATLSQVRDYSARVASAVGAMMCVLMRVRDADALARACDLGVAMQLTNIARDVGEDARAGRLYLPTDWFAEARLDPECFLREPLPLDEVRRMVSRLLSEARRLYIRSEPGIAALPLDARTGIWSARLIYGAIGTEVRRAGCDSVSHRAHTGTLQKAWLMGRAGVRSVTSSVLPKQAVLHAPPLAETAFLVEATRRADRVPHRAAALLSVIADLNSHDASGTRSIGA
ncbi:15-cis-phytoene synthase [Roseisalinus antarcticus]|uniref:All-trans-phytoene synthase/15-cis-phytoene synthase n=1 Tax=Roseisalinus antarcticus TaxID=254357 RepID=A0A1Y5S6H0_9RHOB|nr:phytoene/squalene synthase family protein [Roseisalinus antarcticus]SLN31213.1 All-trans-phytoene synthase/15-cis-phytoene synthase [Roseisalinus antarcticus]